MWQKVRYEECAWNHNPDVLVYIPKSRRRKITPSYQAAVPASVALASPDLSTCLIQRIEDARAAIIRFDQNQSRKSYDLPALILRSESSSSSQIERLTSSVRNVALAEFTDKAPENARLIAGNVAAMRTVLAQAGPITTDAICQIHDTLMEDFDEKLGLRNEQVWIGGTPYSPHEAAFVPPQASRVPSCLQDLIVFSERDDISPIAKAAIFHAQFETIHPFTDGNGRTGRALLHRMLSRDEILLHTTLPISAGLLHDVEDYMQALAAYHDGEIEPIVERVASALELAVVIGARVSSDVDVILVQWQELITERKGSASHRLAALLVEYPVVNVAFVAERLDISPRAVRTLIEVACDRGILSKLGNAKRGAFYQADALLTVLEEASSVNGIRRIASQA